METALDFNEIPLHGRSNELIWLQQALHRIKLGEEKQAIFVRGDSGCGKTSLVQHFGCHIEEAIFVKGKFDAISNQPLSAINEALHDLCNQVAVASDCREKIQDLLREPLGYNFSILQKTFPDCMRTLGYENPTDNTLDEKYETNAMDRLYRSFCDLIEICLESEKVIVMFFDDLHWADDQSWEVICHFIRDLKLARLLVIASYRRDELCYKREAKIQAMLHERLASVLDLENWDFEKVNSLISSVLQMRTSQTKSLASLTFAKSDGNPYFTIEVLKAVKEHNLLRYSLKKASWEWDCFLIQSNINIGDNLVDVILSKFCNIPLQSQKVLILSSCFGSKFDAIVVEAIAMQFFNDDEDFDRLQFNYALDRASIEGILDGNQRSSVYRFAHNKIFEAIYSQISKIGSLGEVHLRIGGYLLLLQNEQPEDKSLMFLSAKQSHYFLHLIETSTEAVQWAKINLEAAKASISLSAYQPAADYLHYGLQFHRDLNWADYDVQLELLVLKARVNLCLGNFIKCYAAVNEVIENASSISEKIPVFQYCIDALSAEGKVNECLRLGLQYAKTLGVKLPQTFNKMTVMMSLFKAKQLMTKKAVERLLDYPMTTNPSIVAAVRILSSMVILASQTQLIDMMATLTLINTTLILIHGFTDEAGSILAMYGSMLARAGDFSNGYAIGKLSLQISERTKSGIPRTYLNFFTGLDHLRNPLHQSLEPLLRGYRIGFEIGDTVSGFNCCLLYITIAFFVGLPLSNLLKDMDSFRKEIDAYNVTFAIDNFRIYYQSAKNLTSNVDNPISLDGEDATEKSLSGCEVQFNKVGFCLGKLMLAVYFNEYQVIKKTIDNLMAHKEPDDGCSYYLNMLLWIEALGLIIVARKTKRRRYRNFALKRIRKVETWVKKGNVNCYHSLMHLRAEMAVLNKEPMSHVKQLFDSAISASRRSGFLNFVAVICERAALYFLEMNDMEWASSYMVDSFEMYQRWGAVRKCLSIIEENPELLPSSLRNMTFESMSKQSNVGTFLKGRERLSVSYSNIHRKKSMDLFTNWGDPNYL